MTLGKPINTRYVPVKPPKSGKAPSVHSTSGMALPIYKGIARAKSVVGGKASHPIGAYTIGQKSHNAKVQEVFGKTRLGK